MAESEEPQKRRRIRGKTSVGNLSVRAPAAEAATAAAAADDGGWSEAFLVDEDLSSEITGSRKTVFLVTLPHPRPALPGQPGLCQPGALTHEQVVRSVLDAFAKPEYVDPGARTRGGPTVRVERMVVFKEKHAPGDDGVAQVHYHVALQLSNTCRFVPVKRALRVRYNLASHWSCSHVGYWSAVRYGVMATPKKLLADLDPHPRAWSRVGQHPPLLDCAQEPNTPSSFGRRREEKMQAASAEGKAEPRATELDLYGVIVEHGFRNTANDPWAHKRLQEYLKLHASPALFQFAFRNRSKLSSLIDDVWSWETVSNDLAMLGKSLWQRFLEAGQGPCVCQGAWRRTAELALQINGIDKPDLCAHLCHSLYYGRCESVPVVVLMGRKGGEGKSFLLSPMHGIFGAEYTQASPQQGSFPLLGLETKRLAVMEDWDFSTHVLPFSTQLLWYEGKAFPITRPQNKDYTGHLLYQGSAPIFITCKEKILGPVLQWANFAQANGHVSQETMLARRLKVFAFTQKLPMMQGAQIPACGACFSNMLQHHAAQRAAA